MILQTTLLNLQFYFRNFGSCFHNFIAVAWYKILQEDNFKLIAVK